MAYCTVEELTVLTGSDLDPTTVLTPIIEAADRRIDATLARAGLTGTRNDADLKEASLHFSIALIVDRGRLTSERPDRLELGSDLRLGNATQSEIDYHERVAADAVTRYVVRASSSGRRVLVRRVN